MYSPKADAGIEARLRVMRVLWAMFLATVGLYAVVVSEPTLPFAPRRFSR